MRYLALACDYDGTLAADGHVSAETQDALLRLRGAGLRLILVTGRELPELLQVFPPAELFDRVIAENGALCYYPSETRERVFAPAPPESFAIALRARGVRPLSIGRVLVATLRPHEVVAAQAIRELGLSLQVILNKESVMILPAGIDKATGLAAILPEMGLEFPHVVGIGDAENDATFLKRCGYSAAVANALPALKEEVDFVTGQARGAGVVELIEHILAGDLPEARTRSFGQEGDGNEQLCGH